MSTDPLWNHSRSARLSSRRCLQVGGLGALACRCRTCPGGGDQQPRGPQRSCVLFLLHGGPSQLDIWDMKPAAPRGGARRVSPGCHERARHAHHGTAAAPGPAGTPLQHRAFHDPRGHQPQCGHVSGDHRQRAAARADRLHADRERLPAPRRQLAFARPAQDARARAGRRRRRCRCRTR